jgi:hypothetical protein
MCFGAVFNIFKQILKQLMGLLVLAGLVLALAPAAPTPFLPLSDLLHNVLRDTP